MYLVVIAWLYVAMMMGVAEANHPQGSLLGAIVTFVLYGVAPVSLLIYFMRRPNRRAAQRQREAAEQVAAQAAAQASAQASVPPDRSGEAAADPVAPVRKEP